MFGEDRCGYARSTCQNLVQKFGGTCRRERDQARGHVPPPQPPPAPDLRGSPPRIVDADTLIVAGERVRLAGIDAPETKQLCRRDGQLYLCGMEATQALSQKIGTGAVTCTLSGWDRYNRALGVCRAADGADLNSWLVRSGHALAYRRYSWRYVPEEAVARLWGYGLWAGEFVAPWDWRRGIRLR